MALAAAQSSTDVQRKARQNLILGALGIVYGDIGTSPLYTVKQCLAGAGGVSEASVLGVLSLIAWARTTVVTFKYVIVIMRADNRGAGGTLALTALALRSTSRRGRRHKLILAAGLVGASLFFGDGVITPAISVLSAVEGLKIATPLFEPYVIPITLALLVGLFLVQRRGTAMVGGFFGPVMALWFSVIAVLGLVQIVRQPEILLALDPFYGVEFLLADPVRGFVILGAVVLDVTGAEALYADMGHFGREADPPRLALSGFPALILNCFGQGALLLRAPEARQSLLPAGAGLSLYPLVVLASVATIIASQAVISGAFSADAAGGTARLSAAAAGAPYLQEERGQIFVPKGEPVPATIAVMALVLGFKSSDNLGTAYGIAVTGTMSLDALLAAIYMIGVLRWNPCFRLLFRFFLLVDLSCCSARTCGRSRGRRLVPVVVAMAAFWVISTWMRGRAGSGRAPARGHATRRLSRVAQARPARACCRHGDLHDRQCRPGARGVAAQPQAQQGAARARGPDDSDHPGYPSCPRRSALHDPASRARLPHRGRALRLRRCAQHPARARAASLDAIPLQSDGDLVLPGPREDRRGQELAAVARAPVAVLLHDQQHAERHGVLPHPHQPRGGTGWPARDLSLRAHDPRPLLGLLPPEKPGHSGGGRP
jgi:KUP system potassium uptake protein